MAKPKRARQPEEPAAVLARAAATHDAAARLRELLLAWQLWPAPEVAAAVARASAIAGRDREAISGVDVAEREKTWTRVERAGDPADLDRLLAVLVDARCEVAMARLSALAMRPRDPRLVEQAVRYVEADPRLRKGDKSPVPFTSKPNRPFWTLLFAIVADRGDATFAPRLRAVAARRPLTTFEDWLSEKCRAVAAELDTHVAPPPSDAAVAALADVVAALSRAEAEVKPSADTADALYAAVWATPDDDGPRLVLADFLGERGDPRGEFITLQLARAAGALDSAGKKREKELLKRHKKRWLGPIEPLIQPHYLRFERGFLATCTLEPNTELEKSLGEHPAWSTIREYYFHDYSKVSARPLAKMLEARGAVRAHPPFTRGIE